MKKIFLSLLIIVFLAANTFAGEDYVINPETGNLDTIGMSSSDETSFTDTSRNPSFNSLGVGTAASGNAGEIDTIGDIGISKADPEIRIIDTGDSEYSRWMRTDTAGKTSIYNRCAKVGSGLEFNGTNEHISLTDIDFSNTSFAIHAWAYPPTGLNAYNIILSSRYTGGQYYIMFGLLNTAKLNFWCSDISPTSFTSTDSVTLDSWNQVWVIFDNVASTITFYINGSADSGGAQSFTGGPTADTSTTTQIGNDNIGTYFKGKLDEIRVYSNTVSSTTVTTHWAAGDGTYGAADETNIWYGWHFDEGTGTTPQDYTTSNNDGTFVNTPDWVAGKVAGIGIEALVLSSQDGTGIGEEGIQTFGHPGGRTVIDGGTLRLNIGGVEQIQIDASGNIDAGDSTYTSTGTLGAGAITGTSSTTSGDIITTDGQIGTTTETVATLGVGVTTFAVDSNVCIITGDGGGNTVATITGGLNGQLLTLIFVDALVTITDDATGNANTVNLSAAFTSTSNDTLTLVFNGTSWYEISRSVN